MASEENVALKVLLPRYSAVYGDAAIYSAPFSVKRYAHVLLTGWAGRGIGTSAPSVTMTLEQSADLGLWHSAGSVSPASGAESRSEFDLIDLEWARMKVEVLPTVGQPPGTTVWAMGAFVLREGERV